METDDVAQSLNGMGMFGASIGEDEVVTPAYTPGRAVFAKPAVPKAKAQPVTPVTPARKAMTMGAKSQMSLNTPPPSTDRLNRVRRKRHRASRVRGRGRAAVPALPRAEACTRIDRETGRAVAFGAPRCGLPWVANRWVAESVRACSDSGDFACDIVAGACAVGNL